MEHLKRREKGKIRIYKRGSSEKRIQKLGHSQGGKLQEFKVSVVFIFAMNDVGMARNMEYLHYIFKLIQ